jgi:hypothetical protein
MEATTSGILSSFLPERSQFRIVESSLTATDSITLRWEGDGPQFWWRKPPQSRGRSAGWCSLTERVFMTWACSRRPPKSSTGYAKGRH